MNIYIQKIDNSHPTALKKCFGRSLNDVYLEGDSGSYV
jgi:hypothetical protein